MFDLYFLIKQNYVLYVRELDYNFVLNINLSSYQYYLTIDCEKKESTNFKKKENVAKKFTGYKAIKRLDKEIISAAPFYAGKLFLDQRNYLIGGDKNNNIFVYRLR